jgi:GT2 family glycosyltransferase
VDIIVPCYNEDASVIERTVCALTAQTFRPRRVLLVDDCSTESSGLRAVSILGAEVVRLPVNRGISAARNTGLGTVDAPIIGFLNVEVLPAPDWLEVCVEYLEKHPRVGLVVVRVLPANTRPLLARWRMRFQEVPYPKFSGPIPWGSGHAMLFRADAIRAVAGFDESMRKAGEDVDICFRLQSAGWEVHFVANSTAVSIQINTFGTLARAEYNRSIYRAETGNGLWRGLGIAADRMLQRSIRHVIFLRWPLLLVEPGIFFHQLPSIWRHR